MPANPTKPPAPYQDGRKIDEDIANINAVEDRDHCYLPRLFALIIGIDTYQSKQFPSLRGAVRDGKKFQDYLMKGLRVPEDQISTLFNERATRSAIIEAFKDLSKDCRINEGDPIFIFYAGHGGQKTPHPDWKEPNKKIEVIIPYDCTDDSDSLIPHPVFVPSIPDITIAALINQIATEKGNNITVVLDSCHSASGTRGGGENSSTRVRSALLGDLEFDSNTDRDIWDCHSRGTRPYTGSSRRGLKSHMLISACRSFEKAIEHEGRGKLSVALLNLLDVVSPKKLRYCDILPNIERIPEQSPQCEGDDQTRLLFDGKVDLSGKVYPINLGSTSVEYILEAGAAHGIAIDAEFMVYRDADKMLKLPLGTLVVDELGAFSAKMKPPPASPLISSRPIPPLSALQTKVGTLSKFLFYIPPEDPFYSLYQREAPRSALNLQNIFLAREPADAHLKIRTSLPSKLLIIELTDTRVTRHGMYVVADQVKPDVENVSWILERAAHYRRELDRDSVEHVITDNDNIGVGFYRLDYSPLRRFGQKENLTRRDENLCDKDKKIIDFVVDEGMPYGVCIQNHTMEDLYVNVFFFDNRDFAISSYYTTHCPSGPHTLESPLKGGGVLPLGYGSGGAETFTYTINQGHDIEVGFLKIYLSTKPFDLSGIAQGSALTQIRGPERWQRPPPSETWDTILIPVIQRRRPL